MAAPVATAAAETAEAATAADRVHRLRAIAVHYLSMTQWHARAAQWHAHNAIALTGTQTLSASPPLVQRECIIEATAEVLKAQGHMTDIARIPSKMEPFMRELEGTQLSAADRAWFQGVTKNAEAVAAIAEAETGRAADHVRSVHTTFRLEQKAGGGGGTELMVLPGQARAEPFNSPTA